MIDLFEIASAIKTIAVFFSVIIISYAGLVILTSKDPAARSEWKEILSRVAIGLCILFLAPVLSSSLTGGGYCNA